MGDDDELPEDIGTTGPAIRAEDPYDADEPGDAVVVSTRRRMQRVVLVAVEAALRFDREGSEEDVMAWMLAPRPMFDGRSAFDACGSHDAFIRAMLMHGLVLDDAATSADLDHLVLPDALPVDRCRLGPAVTAEAF